MEQDKFLETTEEDTEGLFGRQVSVVSTLAEGEQEETKAKFHR